MIWLYLRALFKWLCTVMIHDWEISMYGSYMHRECKRCGKVQSKYYGDSFWTTEKEGDY
jgi:hypothetical protein